MAIALVALGIQPALAQDILYTYDNTSSGAVAGNTLGLNVNGAPATNCAASNPNALVRTFVVSESFTIADVSVGVNASHTTRSELAFVLQSPAGTIRSFLNDGGFDGNDNYDVLVTAQSETGTPRDNDYDNTGLPFFHRDILDPTDNNLGAFVGENSAGTWTLYTCDQNNDGETGTFNRARLILAEASTLPSVCSSTTTYDWGDNGQAVAFVSTVFSGITLSQSSTNDVFGNSVAGLDFETRTTTQGGHAGYYGIGFDIPGTGSDPLDTEIDEAGAMIAAFTYDPPVRDLTFDLLDVDFGGFEDAVRLRAFDSSGARLPIQLDPVSTGTQRVGDILDGDGTAATTATTANVEVYIAGPVASFEVQFYSGDSPNSPGAQFIGISDPVLCAFDFGDSPDSYNTTLGGGARHGLGDGSLYLGSTPPDGEADGAPVAPGASNSGGAGDGVEEDGVAAFPAASTDDGTYTVTVTATNGSGAPAQLCGWIDFGQDGTYEADEGACVTIPASGSNADCTNTGGDSYSCTVTFSVPIDDRGNDGDFYSRFRVSNDPLTTASTGGSASNGEVEGYQATIASLPVVVSWVASAPSAGGVDFAFATASETTHVGFRIEGRTEDGPWRLLRHVASRGIDRQVASTYDLGILAPANLEAPGAGEPAPIEAVRIVDLAIDGRERIHGPYQVGVEYGEPPTTPRIDWAPSRALIASTLETARGASETSARLFVEREGIQRLTHEDLLAAGVDLAGQSRAALAVLDEGLPLPIAVLCDTASASFGAGCAIEFLARPKPTLASAADAYELRVSPSLATRAGAEIGVPREAALGVERERIVKAPDQLYSFSSPNGDPFFDARLLAFGQPASLTRTFDLPDRVAGTVSLDLDLWGVTDFPADDDHHVIVRLNGRELANERFDGLAVWSRTFVVDDWVEDSGNVLEIELPGDTGQTFDLVHLEGFAVEYSRATIARDGQFSGRNAEAIAGQATDGPVRVEGFDSPSIVQWIELASGEFLRAEPRAFELAEGYSVALARLGQSTWLSETARLETPRIEAGIPEPAVPSQADYLIVTHPAFADSLGSLLALQSSRGLTVDVVTTDRIWAAYSDHRPDPSAIRDLVADSLAAGPLRYLLLVGAESYDPQDHLGLGSVSFVPTAYRATSDLIAFAPSDEALADADGDDLADLAVGRLPVRTLDELNEVVAKLWAWEQRATAETALVVSGRSDDGTELDRIGGVYGDLLDSVLFDLERSSVDTDGVLAARAAIAASFSDGTAWIGYVGHSAFGQWDFDSLFDWQDAEALTPGTEPAFVAQWGCWTSYFASPEVETVSDHLLLQPAGAAGTIGATSLTTSVSHRQLGAAFYEALADGVPTIGDALLRARREVAAAGAGRDALLGVALLGDPASPTHQELATGPGPGSGSDRPGGEGPEAEGPAAEGPAAERPRSEIARGASSDPTP